MSVTPPPHPPQEPGHGQQTEDRIDFTKVVSIGLVSLVIFAVSTWWAWTILHRETAELNAQRGVRLEVQTGRTEIGIVDQIPFDRDHRLEIWRNERKRRLNDYGWVDRKRGIIHVPIEQAMDQVVSSGGQKP
jgi:hypothetical protein